MLCYTDLNTSVTQYIRINRRFVRLTHRPPMQNDQSKIDLDLHHTLLQTHKTNTIYNITSPCDAVSYSVSLSALRSLSFCSLYGRNSVDELGTTQSPLSMFIINFSMFFISLHLLLLLVQQHSSTSICRVPFASSEIEFIQISARTEIRSSTANHLEFNFV